LNFSKILPGWVLEVKEIASEHFIRVQAHSSLGLATITFINDCLHNLKGVQKLVRMGAIKELGPIDLIVILGKIQSENTFIELVIGLKHLDKLPDFSCNFISRVVK
jgi:hypothetical protein